MCQYTVGFLKLGHRYRADFLSITVYLNSFQLLLHTQTMPA